MHPCLRNSKHRHMHTDVLVELRRQAICILGLQGINAYVRSPEQQWLPASNHRSYWTEIQVPGQRDSWGCKGRRRMLLIYHLIRIQSKVPWCLERSIADICFMHTSGVFCQNAPHRRCSRCTKPHTCMSCQKMPKGIQAVASQIPSIPDRSLPRCFKTLDTARH